MDITAKSGKFLADIKSTTATTKAPSGSFEAVLSVPTLDRDGEVVDALAFSPLPAHITIDVDHAMTVEKTIGSGRPFYDGEVLKFEGTYASHPLAQMVRSLVDEGHIRTMSVAYMNANYEIDETDNKPHLRSAELLNAGIVGIPSNREALITASKSLAAEVVEAVAPEPTLRKSIVGSFEQRTEQVRQAIRSAFPAAQWAWVRATFDDSVVFEVELPTRSVTYQASYTIGDDGVTLGDPLEVGVAEIVVTAPQKSLHENPTATTPEPTAAQAAVQSPAAVDVALVKARAIAVLAELSLIP